MFHHKVAAFHLKVWSLQFTLNILNTVRHFAVLLLHLLPLEVLLHETMKCKSRQTQQDQKYTTTRKHFYSFVIYQTSFCNKPKVNRTKHRLKKS